MGGEDDLDAIGDVAQIAQAQPRGRAKAFLALMRMAEPGVERRTGHLADQRAPEDMP